jgi:hypothetical protein
MRRALVLLVLFVLLRCLVGCAAEPTPATQVRRTVAVLPPNNLTGDRLVVVGSGLIDRYVRRAQRVTVADVLLSEARFQLLEKGFEVADWRGIAAGIKGDYPESAESAVELASKLGLKDLLLYLEIRRWEPDAPTHTSFVIVGLAASLIDPSTGKVVWERERRAAPVPTPGDILVESAYVTAARRVMREMLAPLEPELAGSQP